MDRRGRPKLTFMIKFLHFSFPLALFISPSSNLAIASGVASSGKVALKSSNSSSSTLVSLSFFGGSAWRSFVYACKRVSRERAERWTNRGTGNAKGKQLVKGRGRGSRNALQGVRQSSPRIAARFLRGFPRFRGQSLRWTFCLGLFVAMGGCVS